MDYSWKNLDELREKLFQLLSRAHPHLVTALSLTFDGDTLVLQGEVASEDCKGDAKRFALAFNGVFKVRNELEVAAYLEPASDSPDEGDFFDHREGRSGLPPWTTKGGRIEGPGVEYGSVDPPSEPESVEVVRHPTFEMSGEVTPANVIDIAIDLTLDPRLGHRPMVIGMFSQDWTSIEVTVQLAAPWLDKINGEPATVTLTPDGSTAARFRCQVSDSYVPGASATLQAYFLHGTRICGHASWSVVDVAVSVDPGPDIAKSDHAAESGLDAGPGKPLVPMVRVVPEAAGPTLSVFISRDSAGGVQSWTWSALHQGGRIADCQEIEIGDAKAFADSLLGSCPDLGSAEFRRRMAGIGERIWRATPERFQKAFTECRSSLGRGFPIQFVTDDPFIPWEMMKPDLDFDRADHLFIEHPVARWPLKKAGLLRQALPGGAILSFVPDYPAHKALPVARAEGDWVQKELGASSMPPTRAAFLDVLDGTLREPVGLIHFAGHGRADSGLNDGGIEMEDAWVGVDDVHQSTVVVGKRDGTLLVLNACESSAQAVLLGMNTGWGAAIAAREFGGMIAPLWEVQDDVAFAMIQAALPPLVGGTSRLGKALTDARRKHCEDSVAAFAYLAHGDVMGRFTTP